MEEITTLALHVPLTFPRNSLAFMLTSQGRQGILVETLNKERAYKWKLSGSVENAPDTRFLVNQLFNFTNHST